MLMPLEIVLPSLLPSAVAWAEAQTEKVVASGRTLTHAEVTLARSVGVREPERIRVAVVDRVPFPNDPALRNAAILAGLSPDMDGLTLGYSVFVRNQTRRLLSHEFRHVYQYEQYGSIAKFLPVYLQQLAQFGYLNAAFEIDARAHELADIGPLG